MDNFNYYKSQLDRLTNLDQVSIKLIDFDGNVTNSMSLNDESIGEVIKLLERIREYQSSKVSVYDTDFLHGADLRGADLKELKKLR